MVAEGLLEAVRRADAPARRCLEAAGGRWSSGRRTTATSSALVARFARTRATASGSTTRTTGRSCASACWRRARAGRRGNGARRRGRVDPAAGRRRRPARGRRRVPRARRTTIFGRPRPRLSRARGSGRRVTSTGSRSSGGRVDLEPGRRIRRAVRRRDAARVPRPRPVPRDGRAPRRARARGRLPATSTSTRCRRAGRSSSALGFVATHDDDAVRHSSRSSLSAAQRGSTVSSTCSCGSTLRSLPQTGQSPAQSGSWRICSGSARTTASCAQAERSSWSSTRYSVESSSLSGFVAWYSRRRSESASSASCEAAEARAVERDVERELEHRAARRARDDELGRDGIRARLVLLPGEMDRLEVDLDALASLVAGAEPSLRRSKVVTCRP